MLSIFSLYLSLPFTALLRPFVIVPGVCFFPLRALIHSHNKYKSHRIWIEKRRKSYFRIEIWIKQSEERHTTINVRRWSFIRSCDLWNGIVRLCATFGAYKCACGLMVESDNFGEKKSGREREGRRRSLKMHMKENQFDCHYFKQ